MIVLVVALAIIAVLALVAAIVFAHHWVEALHTIRRIGLEGCGCDKARPTPATRLYGEHR